ncbi:hypothetical protein SLS62_005598 [Diatrype stigma]|uniref:Diphthine--ammonia ligase n=1 Tax=Diatrype stigma TaxID=117547 RepID=A0AAN9UPE9_9PEZI
MAEGALNVIALVSGGKDSFFSILHCLANGHQVVALANLYPQSPPASTSPAAAVAIREPSHDTPSQQHQGEEPQEEEDEADLNSFMYQTVGHQVIPLYAQATGLPLFRHPIVGGAVHHGLNYQAPQEREEEVEGSRAAAAAVGATAIPPPSADESITTASAATTATTTTTNPQVPPGAGAGAQEQEDQDETESLVPLLRAVLAAHPEANALSTGAILSTYQRTRVESVALRLGLVPLSYLWQYPELPLDRGSGSNNNGGDSNAHHSEASDATGKAGTRGTTRKSTGQQQQQEQQLWKTLLPGLGPERGGARAAAPLLPPRRDDAQLLRDMAAAGLDARIIKVASAGLDESFLWENVASEAGAQRVARGIGRFGGGGRGSVLGEGGEFETLVVDGPPGLFRGGRIVVPASEEGCGSSGGGNRRVVREGGGSVWLSIRGAVVEARDGDGGDGVDGDGRVRIPGLLDPRFEATLEALLLKGDGEGETDQDQSGHDAAAAQLDSPHLRLPPLGRTAATVSSESTQQQWCFVGRDDDDQVGGVEAQTARIVADIRERLQGHALRAGAITNAIVVLRRMADFPAINKLYGSLFGEPNPPARVTISCGDALPEGCDIAVYLAVHAPRSHGGGGDDRLGLHVQSRSYWAPANIGPYSQAISVPLLSPPPPPSSPPPPASSSSNDDSDDDDDGQLYYSSSSSTDTGLAVSIAGQIPLIPASMVLPSADCDGGESDSTSDRNLALQTTLALQHLWRVAAAVDVQWWTSAVAYFPRVSSSSSSPSSSSSSGDQDERRRRTTAQLAAAAWRSAHVWAPIGEDEEEDDDDDCCGGPDLWDRRYNSAYQSFGNEEADTLPEVPDWEVLAVDKGDADADSRQEGEEKRRQRQRCVPFFFAAEVDELPRQAGIEWHAHLGLAKLRPGSVRVFSRRGRGEGEHDARSSEDSPARVSSELHHVAVETPHGGVFIQSAAAVRCLGGDRNLEAVVSDVRREVAGSLAAAAAAGSAPASADDAVASPHIVYVDAGVFPTAFAQSQSQSQSQSQPQAIIPCRSLWDCRGNRLALVVLFQSRFPLVA